MICKDGDNGSRRLSSFSRVDKIVVFFYITDCFLIVKQREKGHIHITQRPTDSFLGECVGGVFGVVLGECLANTHPVGLPLYKGIAGD